MAGFQVGTRKTETAISTQTVAVPQPEQYSPAAYVANDIGEYRGRFADETKSLSDKQLFDIVMGTTDDMSDDDWKSLFLSSKPNAPGTPDGDDLAEHAAELAAKESKAMHDTFERVAKAREDWQGGPLYTLLALKSTYTDEELSEFAIPGSDTGTNPDKFTITTRNGDKTGTKKTTFYAQFARNTKSGLAIIERQEWLERAADKGTIKDGIPEDILEMSPEQRLSHKAFLSGRLNTMTQAYKKAMQLHFKLEEVNAYADNITAAFIWEEGGSPDKVENLMDCKVVPTTEPIAVWLHEEGKPITKWEPFSIGAFLKLNPAKATEQGGGFKKLVESGATKKAPGTPGGNGQKEPDLVIKTVDKGLGVLVEFHRWLQEIRGERDQAEYGKLTQELAKKKDNDEYVVSIVELKNILSDICRDTNADAKYVKLVTAGSPLIGGAKDKSA